MKFKLYIDRERCKGCMLCVTACPKKILEMSRKMNSRGFHFAEMSDADSCIGCRCCADICPDAAIEIECEISDDSEEAAAVKSTGKVKKK